MSRRRWGEERKCSGILDWGQKSSQSTKSQVQGQKTNSSPSQVGMTPERSQEGERGLQDFCKVVVLVRSRIIKQGVDRWKLRRGSCAADRTQSKPQNREVHPLPHTGDMAERTKAKTLVRSISTDWLHMDRKTSV